MLSVVLLHVVESARPIDPGGDLTGLDRPVQQVQNGAAALLRIDHPGCAQGAAIARLSTSLGIERGAIEDRCRLSLEFADLQHARLKRLEIRVLQVEAFRHSWREVSAFRPGADPARTAEAGRCARAPPDRRRRARQTRASAPAPLAGTARDPGPMRRSPAVAPARPGGGCRLTPPPGPDR